VPEKSLFAFAEWREGRIIRQNTQEQFAQVSYVRSQKETGVIADVKEEIAILQSRYDS
jgi:hypothetical protein